jgi:NAD(P)H-dependent flavin oxidoreductase YrpB (nitropropane dioxygenase family)
MNTILCERLGIELPIIQAPMGGAVGPKLAAAVSNAGGLGMLVLWRADSDAMRQQIREMRALTSRPFGVRARVCRRHPVAALITAADPLGHASRPDLMRLLRLSPVRMRGIIVVLQLGTPAAASAASAR